MISYRWRNNSVSVGPENDSIDSLSIESENFQPIRNEAILSLFTVAYVIIFIFGSCGNVLTCLVVIKRRYVHSQTPFYLNLAFSDLLLLIISLPIDVYFFWRPFEPFGGTWFCIVRALITEAATNASISTIVIFTAERWISICRPFKSVSNSIGSSQFGQMRPCKNVKLIVIIWLVSLIAASPLCVQLGVVQLIDPQSGKPMPDAGICHVTPSRAIPYSFEVSSVLFFVMPMILITIFYSKIIIELRRTIKQPSGNDSPQMDAAGRARQQAKASGAVVKILIAVVVAFFICFSPHHLQRLLASYLSATADERWAHFAQLLFTISGLFYYISTAVNPLIYCLFSKRFRFALRNLTSCGRRCRKNKQNRDGLFLKGQSNRRAMLIKANACQTGYAAIIGSRTRLCYPLSSPAIRRRKDIDKALARPKTLSLSSPCLKKIPRNQSPCNQKKNTSGIATRKEIIEACAQSDCCSVYVRGDKLVISFVSDSKGRASNSV